MNEDHKPDWYTHLKQPVPGGGFSDHKIEETRNLATTSTARNAKKHTWKRFSLYGGMTLALAVMLLLWTGMDSVFFSKVNNDIRVGHTYTLHGVYGTKEQPEGITNEYVFNTRAEEQFTVEELSGSYAKITSGDTKGWLPQWYLTSETLGIKAVTPYLMLVPKAGAALYLYPGSTEFDALPLDHWRVVRVVAEYDGGTWVKVDFRLFDAAYFGDRWMKVSDLQPYDAKLAKEGQISQGTVIYDESGNPTTDRNFGTIIIHDEVTLSGKGTFYRVSGPGGFSGLIKQEDFIADPFAAPDEASNSIIEIPEFAAGTAGQTLMLPHNWTAIRQEFEPEPGASVQARYSIVINDTTELGEWTIVSHEPLAAQAVREDWPKEAWPGTVDDYTVTDIEGSLGKGQMAVVHFVQSTEDAQAERSNTTVFISIPVKEAENLWYSLQLNLPYLLPLGVDERFFIEAAKQIMGVRVE